MAYIVNGIPQYFGVGQIINNKSANTQPTKVADFQVVDGRLVADFRSINPGVMV